MTCRRATRPTLGVGLCGLMLALTSGIALGEEAGAASPPAASDAADSPKTTVTDRYLELGTPSGVLGGADQKGYERAKIKEQILTFIPPLLRPAFVGHAFVLPPDVWSVSIAERVTDLDGDDFFMNGRPNRAVFADADVDRRLTDLDLAYGFDLGRKYLHGFTVALNVPYLDSRSDGSIHPNGQQFIAIENAGSTQGIGDIALLLKKKVWDQGHHPFNLAVAGGVLFPTGNNDDTFGSNGRVTTRRPQPMSLDEANGFDALAASMVAQGMWNNPMCIFHNVNLASNGACGAGPLAAPSGMPLMFAPGGPMADNQFIGRFPWNNGVFGRFAMDGRLPSTLQPGTGAFGYFLGAFLTRQFNPGDWPGRSALHLGVTHNFVSKDDGIDFGDKTTYFASFVKPIYKDYLALDLTFVGFDQGKDSYPGAIPEPGIHPCTSADIGVVMGCMAVGDPVFYFDLKDRESFAGGFTGMVAPSLIFSPDPQIRFTVSVLKRVIAPNLGPAPPTVFRAALEVTF